MKKIISFFASIIVFAGCSSNIENPQVEEKKELYIIDNLENNLCNASEDYNDYSGYSIFCVNEYHHPTKKPSGYFNEALLPTSMTLKLNNNYDLKFKRIGECDDNGCKGGFDIYLMNKAYDSEKYLYNLGNPQIYNTTIKIDEFSENLIKIHFFIETLGGEVSTLYIDTKTPEVLLHHVGGYSVNFGDKHYKFDLEFEKLNCDDQNYVCNYKTSTITVNSTNVYKLSKEYISKCEQGSLCIPSFLDAGMPDFENKTIPIYLKDTNAEGDMIFNYETGEFINLAIQN